MKPTETIKYRGFNIEICQDDIDAGSPREWDNLGTMVCKHSRYELGDEQTTVEVYEDLIDEITQEHGKCVMLNLFLLDHSGIWMSTGKFPCDTGGWDTSHVGVIYCSYAKAKREYGWKAMTKARIRKIKQMLDAEVKIYSDYISGNVVGYNVDGTDDSCWGYIGDDGYKQAIADAKASIDAHIEHTTAQHVKKVKAYIKNRVPLDKRKSL